MPRVSIDDPLTAAEWLEINEGEEGEAEACARVAQLLKKEANRRIRNSAIRQVAREHGRTVNTVRQEHPDAWRKQLDMGNPTQRKE